MFDHFEYLLLMAACLAVTLPLELVLGARVYRRPRRMTAAVLPTMLIFSVWDILAIQRNLWGYNPRFVSGIQLPFGLPVEELAFFFVIPVCALLTFEAIGRVRHRSAGGSRRKPDA